MIDLKIEGSLQLISLVTDGSEIYLNQYGKTFTVDELGSFDIIKGRRSSCFRIYSHRW